MDTIIGKPIPRFDAYDKVTGAAKYAADFDLPGQLFLKTIFSPSAHAIIQSIDTSKAEACRGVVKVLTAKDVPCNEYGLLVNDQPVLCGPGSAKIFSERVRCVGDRVAFLIAESEEIAQQAAELVKIAYKELPIITDPVQSKNLKKPLVHPELISDRCSHYQVRKGDVQSAFRMADVIIEDTYCTPPQEHAFLQPEAGLAFMDGENIIHIITAGQWAHGDQRQVAHALGLAEDRIRIEYAAIGGAFGGKEDISVQIALGLAVLWLAQMGIHRPVKTVWSREESFIGHHKRHAFQIYAKWGALRSGKILAAEMRLIADAGAYASSTDVVLKSASIAATGPYEIPNVYVDADAFYTNNVPGGAFRGFGVPQACFAVEMQINKLAQALQIDPVELRLKNAIQEGGSSLNQTSLPPGVGITEVIKKCADAVDWKENRSDYQGSENLGRYVYGWGFAAGFKSFGIAPDECWAKVELIGGHEIEQVRIYHAAADMGQGAHSVLKQFAAETLAVPVEQIDLIVSDTAFSANSGSTSASRMTYMAGHAVQAAAKKALHEWQKEERPATGEEAYHSPPTTEVDEETGKGYPNFGAGYAAEAIQVRVDRETGEIDVLDMVCADDVGKAINPQQVRGQMEGCLIQALGYTQVEEFMQKNGTLQTKNLSTYLIPTVRDIPQNVKSIIVEVPDPNGPHGAKGMGEIPYGPFAPAFCAAVHAATGVWFNSLPLKPEKVVFNILNDKKLSTIKLKN